MPRQNGTKGEVHGAGKRRGKPPRSRNSDGKNEAQVVPKDQNRKKEKKRMTSGKRGNGAELVGKRVGTGGGDRDEGIEREERFYRK